MRKTKRNFFSKNKSEFSKIDKNQKRTVFEIGLDFCFFFFFLCSLFFRLFFSFLFLFVVLFAYFPIIFSDPANAAVPDEALISLAQLKAIKDVLIGHLPSDALPQL